MQACLHVHTLHDKCIRNPDCTCRNFKTQRCAIYNRFETKHLLLTYFACIEIPTNICVNTDPYLSGITMTHKPQYSYDTCDRIQLTLKHTCAGSAQTSRCVFTYRLIHGIVQFTMRITFRCTFHRAPNPHINRDTCKAFIYVGFHNVCTTMHNSSRHCRSMVGAHIKTHAHTMCM